MGIVRTKAEIYVPYSSRTETHLISLLPSEIKISCIR